MKKACERKLAVLLAVMLVFLSGCGQKNAAGAQESAAPEKPEVTALEFPCTLEGGKLEVTSLFQYSGDNPDCGGETGEDIGSLAVTNLSDQHLTHATLVVLLAGGGKLAFEVQDVPAGQTVWAFETSNAVYDLDDLCVDIGWAAEFEPAAPVLRGVTAEASGTTVTLTNTTSEDLTNLTVYCHCWFNELNFGGLTYAYPVSSIPAGESVEIQAEECYLGEAAVVRVSKGD